MTSGDLISRQAVLDRKYVVEVKNMWHITEEIEVVNADDIKALPPVRPQEPKTGHWKRISIDKYSEHAKYWYRCDRCGKDNLGNTDWCPNCGARMEREEN